MSKENNIFDYATKELSQDAVICWMLNWVNYPDSELHNLGKDMFALIGEENVNVNQKIEIFTQFEKTDIVVVLHGDGKIIIIEDKKCSSEHSDQMNRYKTKLGDRKIQKKLGLDDNFLDKKDIKVVYFKTGFFYDKDKIINDNVDKVVDGRSFLECITKYKDSKSEILQLYKKYLSDSLSWYDEYGNFEKDNYVSIYTNAQYKLMRAIFDEDRWDKKSDLFMVEDGTSYGRPWTEMNIFIGEYSDKDRYYVFWRIDTNKKGPYISLRFYENFEKSDEGKLERHRKYYNKFKELVEKIIEDKCFDIVWDKVKCGDRSGYKESAMISVVLSEYLRNWETEGKKLIEDLNTITDEFNKAVEEEVKKIEK